jgi:hypothetical protein
MAKIIAPGLFLLSIALLVGITTSCGGRATGSQTNPSCQGTACLNWTTSKADFCQQFSSIPNEAFQAVPKSADFTLPITIFYKVLQTNASGTLVNTTPEQSWRVPSGQGSVLPICHAAQTGTTEVDTQTLQLTCVTNRALPNGSTSANCVGAELTNVIVNPFIGDFTKEVAGRMALGSPQLNDLRISSTADSRTADLKTADVGSSSARQMLWAPSALSPGAQVDCTSTCDNQSGICIHVSSTVLNVNLQNLVNSWKPGTSINKATATAALGVTDNCDRSSTLVNDKGLVANKGSKPCSVPLDFQGQPVMVNVPHEVVGEATVGASKRQVDFWASKELQLELPGDLAIYGGPILYISEPIGQNRTAVDFRTPTACVRVHEH